MSRYDFHRKIFFDGRIGCCSFIITIHAQICSQNRLKLAPVTLPLDVHRDVYRLFLVLKVFPAIREKFQVSGRRIAEIQQGGPRDCCSRSDQIAQNEGRRRGLK